MTSTTPKALQGHLPALDGIRGIAILLVLLLHLDITESQTVFDLSFWRQLIGYGWCGVDLFFVLSGFLITGILVKAKGAKHYLRNFYLRRVLRIWPLYLAIVFFSLILLPLYSHPELDRWLVVQPDAAWYWLHLSNYSTVMAGKYRHAILDISWSLSVEEQFYLVWPFLVMFFSRKGMMRVCLAIMVGALGLRCVLVWYEVNPLATYMLTPCRIDQLAFGSLLALIARSEGGWQWLSIQAKRWIWISGAMVVALIALTPGRGSAWTPLANTIGFSIHAVFFGCFLVLGVNAPRDRRLFRVLNSRFLRVFGKYSYALYLLHYPISYALRYVTRGTPLDVKNWPTVGGSQVAAQLLFYVASIGATLVASWVSWHVLEKRMLSLKRFFPASGDTEGDESIEEHPPERLESKLDVTLRPTAV